MDAKAPERIRLSEKLGYGIGDLPSGLYLNFFAAYLLYFFVDLGGVAPAAMALMLLLSRVFDAITDPVMGLISDRTRTRWGRYRPYLLFGAIPYGITGFLIFSAPEMSPGWLLVWAYATYGVTMLAFTAVNVPYGGLLGVISPSATQRANVTAYRMFFSGLSGILVGVLATTLIRELGAGDEARGVMLTMAVFAAVSVVCYLITFATTQERIPPSPTNNSVRGDLGNLVRTGAWVALAVSSVFGVLAIASRASSARFYYKYVVGDDGAPVFLFLDRFGLFLTALALGQVSGVVIGYLLQNRFEKSHLIISGGFLKGAGILAFWLMPIDAVWGQTLAQLFVGIGFGFLMVLAFSMFTDIAEFIDWKFGKPMTALTLAASVFAVKVGAGLGSALPGLVLEWNGFDPGAAQSAEAIAGINAAFAVIPGLILIPAGIAMLFYRLDHATIARIERDLSVRRTAAAGSGE
ncbi:MFS transporter [Erythrobacter aurantius]|uniref:MFS transporter n=1 Tax=Erythrobacter aurantius TaxID=2909249 RepID=UPI00207A80B7|nr:glycoside-pentoside-hexuronide (GPH):cation symporter [Erythrobacter aurantius]